jgi:hypothetical protein
MSRLKPVPAEISIVGLYLLGIDDNKLVLISSIQKKFRRGPETTAPALYQ